MLRAIASFLCLESASHTMVRIEGLRGPPKKICLTFAWLITLLMCRSELQRVTYFLELFCASNLACDFKAPYTIDEQRRTRAIKQRGCLSPRVAGESRSCRSWPSSAVKPAGPMGWGSSFGYFSSEEKYLAVRRNLTLQTPLIGQAGDRLFEAATGVEQRFCRWPELLVSIAVGANRIVGVEDFLLAADQVLHGMNQRL